MTKAITIFTLDNCISKIECIAEDKMKDICQKYSKIINIDIGTLHFIIGGKKINFELSFNEHSNSSVPKSNQLEVYVNKKEKKDNDINLKSKKLFNNIKSIYIIKKIFNHLDEKKKLKAIKYNKKLQKKFNIKLINYKFLSSRYIIYENNIKGKEYKGDSDILLFEGEYKNGERNGKGKEYDDRGRIKFEGEYINGKRNGKGKEYDENGNERFIGEYLKGKKVNGKIYDSNGNLSYDLENINGLIKEYDYSGKLQFEGEYKNGQRNGNGKEYDSNAELVFEGEYLNGEKNGIGKDYYSKGTLHFEGEYLNGEKHGKGKVYNYNGELTFEGEYKSNKKWIGKGFNGADNIVYELKDGKGYIKEYRYGKLEFEGDFFNGQKSGKGKKYYNKKLMFDGEYLYDMKLKGKEYINEKLVYEGEYLFNKKYHGKLYDKNGNINEIIQGNGKVKEYDSYGKLEFEGEYLNGKRNGKGKEYSIGYLIFEGEYSNGQRNGKGRKYSFGAIKLEEENSNQQRKEKDYNSNDKIIFEGEYLNGKRWNGKGKEYGDNGKIKFEGVYTNGQKYIST